MSFFKGQVGFSFEMIASFSAIQEKPIMDQRRKLCEAGRSYIIEKAGICEDNVGTNKI